MAKTQRTLTKIALIVGLTATGLTTFSAQADQLADIKAKGVVKVATFDANPPFGSVDAKTHELVGYDVDFAFFVSAASRKLLKLIATLSIVLFLVEWFMGRLGAPEFYNLLFLMGLLLVINVISTSCIKWIRGNV